MTVRYRPGCRSLTHAPLQVVMFPMVSSQHLPMRSMDTSNQGVALASREYRECQVHRLLVPDSSGDADVLIDVRKRHAGSQQLLSLGFRVAAPVRRLWGGWIADCTMPL